MRNFRAIFRRFSADFSAQFARNLHKLRTILAHFQRNFCANFAFFPRDFLQGLIKQFLFNWPTSVVSTD